MAPDGVTGRATLAGMRLNAPRLRQLAQEAKLCTSLCPHIGGVNSTHAMMSMVGKLLEYLSMFFLLSLKEDLRTLPPVEIGILSTYLHTHMPKINSSPVKILKRSWKVGITTLLFLKIPINFVGNLSNFDKILIINFVLACSYSNVQHYLGKECANNTTERGHGKQRDTNEHVSNMTGRGGAG